LTDWAGNRENQRRRTFGDKDLCLLAPVSRVEKVEMLEEDNSGFVGLKMGLQEPKKCE
jgi:hypothetical protein